MKILASLLIGALLPSAGFSQQAPVDDAPPDAAALDVQLTSLSKLREQKKNEYFLQVRSEIERPVQNSGAAGNFVIGCMKKMQFEGHPGANLEFAEWKKKNADLLSNHDFEQAADLHLRYLALTLKRATLESAESLQTEIWDYLRLLNQSSSLLVDVVRNPAMVKIKIFDQKTQEVSGEMLSEIEDQRLARAENARSYVKDLLSGSVNSGLVAQAYKLDKLLVDVPDWEMVPGDFSGIMEQDVRACLRKSKDPRIVATWDFEIAYLSSLAQMKKDDNEVAKFERETTPKLRWKQAKDVELIGLPNRALSMRIAVAKQYPQHPDFNQWAADISSELKKRKAEALAAKAAKAGDASGAAAGTPPGPTPDDGAPAEPAKSTL